MTAEVFEGPQLLQERACQQPAAAGAVAGGGGGNSVEADIQQLKQLRHSFECGQGAVRAVRFSADGCFAISCGADRTVALWSPHRPPVVPAVAGRHAATPLAVYRGHGDQVLAADGACDNGRLVSAGADRSVIVWDVTGRRPLNKWRGHHGAVNAVRFNEDASVVVSGARDGSVRVWDCRSGGGGGGGSGGGGGGGGGVGTRAIQILDQARDSVQSVCVSDHEIVSGAADGCVRRYDLRNGRLSTDTVAQQPVSCVALSGDGQCLVASSTDATVRLIDKSNGQLLNAYRGHANTRYPLHCCLDAGDRLVLSGSEDGAVWGWHLVSGESCLRLQHPPITGGRASSGSVTVHSLSCHPHLPSLLTAAGASIFVWGCAVQR